MHIARVVDVNLALAGLLFDLAFLAGDNQRSWGFKRAAKAVLRLDRQITPLVEANTFRAIAGIGPTTDRIAREVIHDGTSGFVEQSVRDAGKSEEVAALRALREHFLSRAAVREIVDRTGPLSTSRYRGDFQMHSVWSDGAEPLESIVEACLGRGHRCAGITDHSYGLSIAGGMSMAAAAEQHLAIDELNRRYQGRFRMYKGIEANIRADGSVDMTPDERATLELVVAAPHSVLRSPSDQTARMIAAVATPGVHILGHPRGRIYGSRPGVSARWNEVFDAAAQSGVAVELDGDPARQDMDFAMAQAAVAAGCLFALDSDAHAVDQLSYAETAIAHARLAGIPADRVINCWPLERLLDWLVQMRSRTAI